MPPITKLTNFGTLASWIDADIDVFSFSHANLNVLQLVTLSIFKVSIRMAIFNLLFHFHISPECSNIIPRMQPLGLFF